ncbi:hypothetical protein NPIL_494691 [Nephila pilipes]|uniref:Uncharacterized protein n=1 Tax=Nephila pilipes TaxID=299642 RepID=A0A8X6MUQ8_NEPPI|nr:hypothetical protein NPIL_494691 [Nephila pilipes]
MKFDVVTEELKTWKESIMISGLCCLLERQEGARDFADIDARSIQSVGKAKFDSMPNCRAPYMEYFTELIKYHSPIFLDRISALTSIYISLYCG